MRELDFYIKKLQDLEYRGEWKETYFHSYEKVHLFVHNSHFHRKTYYLSQLESFNDAFLDLPYGSSDEDKLNFRRIQKHIIDLIFQIRTENQQIFIVHGSDSHMSDKVESFLARLKLDFNIIDRNASAYRNLKQFVDIAKECDYAIVLFSPDDLGGKAGSVQQRYRVSQEVLLQMGYFLSHVGRKHLLLLYSGDKEIESPFDFEDIKFGAFDEEGKWKTFVIEALHKAGIYIDKELESKLIQ
ncbi:MAG TPA: TIR domain-containing protein [Cytophagaceae bacterium]|jgi:hypothetical protein